MFDLYSKIVLTVIAIALTAVAAQNWMQTTYAQSNSCGNYRAPCYVATTLLAPLSVRIER